MQTNYLQFADEASNAHKSAFESFGRLNETNAQTLEKLVNVQLEVANLCFEGGAKQLQLWSNAKDYREALAEQSKLTDEYGKKFMQCAQQTLGIITGARDAYTSLLEQNVDKATENFKRTASKRAA